MLFCWKVEEQPRNILYRSQCRRWRQAANLILREATALYQGLFWRCLAIVPPPKPRAQQPHTLLLFVPGLWENRGSWLPLWRYLRQRHPHIKGVPLSLPQNRGLKACHDQLAHQINKWSQQGSYQRIVLVGHSFGGLLARSYIQHQPPKHPPIHMLITLGTPHEGSFLAPLAFSPLARFLAPGNLWLRRLQRGSWPAHIRTINIYSQHDNLVLPPQRCYWAAAQNVSISNCGHQGLVLQRAVHHRISNLLQEDEYDAAKNEPHQSST